MKTKTPAGRTPAPKNTARKSPGPNGNSLEARIKVTIELPAIPTVWSRAAKDLGYSSVEEWAAASLDVLAWPGDRILVTSTGKQNERWSHAAFAQGMGLYEWIDSTLNAACPAVEAPQKGGRP